MQAKLTDVCPCTAARPTSLSAGRHHPCPSLSLRILVCLVMYDSGKVCLELSRYPSQPHFPSCFPLFQGLFDKRGVVNLTTCNATQHLCPCTAARPTSLSAGRCHPPRFPLIPPLCLLCFRASIYIYVCVHIYIYIYICT